jgi:glycosyltransferase involved in cell wall biosynthesis
MAERLGKEGAQASRIAIIPNWANGDLVRPIDALNNPLRKDWGLDGKFVAGYSGNLGRVHELDAIIEAMAELADTGLTEDRPIAFLFIGGGALYPRLHREIARRGWTNVQFQPHQPAEQLAESLSVPDIHLISLRPEFEGLVVPSKLYGILAAGRPALFIGDKDGEVARLLRQADCGITVHPSEGKALAKHIADLAMDPLRVAAMGQRARSAFEMHFDKAISLAEWMRCLAAVHASPSPHGAGVMQVSPQRP